MMIILKMEKIDTKMLMVNTETASKTLFDNCAFVNAICVNVMTDRGLWQ
jgi:hypothetical protein